MDTFGISTRLLDLQFHRGAYLPHCQGPGALQFVTFRVADSVPPELFERWGRELADLPRERRAREMFRRVERVLDEGHGEAPLTDPRLAEIVVRVLRHFDGRQYDLMAFVIMPTHVHVLFAIRPGFRLEKIVGAWKGYSAARIHRLLGREGAFWARDYYDRIVRDEQHLADVVAYVRAKPVKAGLCASSEAWRWSRVARDPSAVASQSGSAPADSTDAGGEA